MRAAIREKQKQLVDYLSGEIAAGKLKPGEKIPSMRDLMQLFDISYSSTLKAIDQLHEHGLLKKVNGSGTYVRRS